MLIHRPLSVFSAGALWSGPYRVGRVLHSKTLRPCRQASGPLCKEVFAYLMLNSKTLRLFLGAYPVASSGLLKIEECEFGKVDIVMTMKTHNRAHVGCDRPALTLLSLTAVQPPGELCADFQPCTGHHLEARCTWTMGGRVGWLARLCPRASVR